MWKVNQEKVPVLLLHLIFQANTIYWKDLDQLFKLSIV